MLPLPVLAEGRNDPLLACSFDNGREVTLAENGDALVWLQGDETLPAGAVSDLSQTPVVALQARHTDGTVGQLVIRPGSGAVQAHLTEVTLRGHGFATRMSSGRCRPHPG
jgi:hypothetical protein